jgi:preprotein translocase subunit SecE
VNREMRRLQAKEEERAKKRRKAVPQQRKRERVGFRQFLHEVRQELKKVAWPTREETTTFTVVVLIVTAAVTGYTFALDFGLKNTILELLGAVG